MNTTRAAVIVALSCWLSGCMTLTVGTAATVVKLGTSVMGVGVSVGKTVVKTGASVAADLAVP
jgi:hypothetical protein